MEEVKKPEEAAPAGEQPWIRMLTGVLQFIGGGLVALHEEGAPTKARDPETAAERDIRERVEGLGIKMDHADTIRRNWVPPAASARAASPSTNPAGVSPIPTLSFEEFAAAAAVHLGSSEAPAAAASGEARPSDSSPPGSSSGTTPSASERSASSPARDGSSTGADVASQQRTDLDPQAKFMDMRLAALETKCRELQQLLAAEGPRDADCRVPLAPGDSVATSHDHGSAEEQVAIQTSVEAAPTAPTGDAADGSSSATRVADTERKTVVQGPWAMGRVDAGNGAAVEPPGEPGGIYDAHERRVAALERTFESFGRMVEGLAARPRGKGPPPE